MLLTLFIVTPFSLSMTYTSHSKALAEFVTTSWKVLGIQLFYHGIVTIAGNLAPAFPQMVPLLINYYSQLIYFSGVEKGWRESLYEWLKEAASNMEGLVLLLNWPQH